MKKNNKGFSLIELIVVVLIMAILAVALAPQVTKWVDRSKLASDKSNYETLVSEAQLVVINSAAREALEVDKYIIVFDQTGIKLYKGTETVDNLIPATPAAGGSENAIDVALDNIDSQWRSVVANTGSYKITINQDGTVTKTSAPDVDDIDE